jgi:hypothetical protein
MRNVNCTYVICISTVNPTIKHYFVDVVVEVILLYH